MGAMDTSIDAKLARIFEADKALRTAQQDFSSTGDERVRVDALSRAVDLAWAMEDDEEGTERLMRLGDLLTDVGGPTACKILVRLLDHEDPGVRASAGEGLIELGHARYAEVARAIEKVVDEGKAVTSLTEVPYILAELGEPGGVKLCIRLLKHAEGDVVAAAIEGLAALGDPSAAKEIEKLRNDKRRVTVEEELETGELTVGELASEAVDHLRTTHD